MPACSLCLWTLPVFVCALHTASTAWGKHRSPPECTRWVFWGFLGAGAAPLSGLHGCRLAAPSEWSRWMLKLKFWRTRFFFLVCLHIKNYVQCPTLSNFIDRVDKNYIQLICEQAAGVRYFIFSSFPSCELWRNCFSSQCFALIQEPVKM